MSLALGAIFFTFQIYGDFSGYSDIAIGTSRLFGFDLKQNFAFPYFSRDVAEFWRRWHISLSTWFRDYIYIPLGGSYGNNWTKVRNTFIIFIVSGFWHGANWTYIIWGTLNAIYFLPLLLTKNNRNHIEIVAKGKYLPTLRELLFMLITFALTVFAWIFFRAENILNAFQYIHDLICGLKYKLGYVQTINLFHWNIGFGFALVLLLFILFEWMGREGEYAISDICTKCNRPMRYIIYYAIIITIIWYCDKQQEFIYFQF
jgi:D-alanyl-lipoteichoic acid acyltransferase DltB (MBOAT superfamily)